MGGTAGGRAGSRRPCPRRPVSWSSISRPRVCSPSPCLTREHPSTTGKWAVPGRAPCWSRWPCRRRYFVVLETTPEPQPIALPSTTLPRTRGGSCAPPPRETWSRPHQLRGRPEFFSTTMVVSVLSTTSVRVVVQGWSVLSVTRIGVPGSRSFLGRLGNSRAFEAGAPLAVVELAGPPSAFFGSGSGASPADQRGSSALLPPSSSEPIARDDNTIAGRHAINVRGSHGGHQGNPVRTAATNRPLQRSPRRSVQRRPELRESKRGTPRRTRPSDQIPPGGTTTATDHATRSRSTTDATSAPQDRGRNPRPAANDLGLHRRATATMKGNATRLTRTPSSPMKNGA